jgi:hypothetical protein
MLMSYTLNRAMVAVADRPALLDRRREHEGRRCHDLIERIVVRGYASRRRDPVRVLNPGPRWRVTS